MTLRCRVRIGADPGSTITGHTHKAIRKGSVTGRKRRAFGILAAVTVLVPALCKADVPTPTAPPAVPAGYCTSIYSELFGDLQAFNTQLATPPTWTPVPGGPTLYAANLSLADSNSGPQISGAGYLQSTLVQLQELQAMGVQAVVVSIGFPVLYEPFYGSEAALAPYLTFYTQVAQAVKAAGLKLIVDQEELFSNDIAAGWTEMNPFYVGLTWPEYMVARAQMAATVAQTMLPDYFTLADEPDTEATQTGQQNLNDAADAAQMIAGEIAAVQALNLSPAPQLGAGFGTWLEASGSSSLVSYTNAYLTLPLNYLDLHVIPVNTLADSSDIGNSLIVASMAAAVGRPVAIGQAWLEKAEASELNVLSSDVIRARGPFSFWAPLDGYFVQTMQALAKYTQMIYMAPDEPIYFFAYQPYGGTVANGGAANCTCTTATCSDYDIMQTENSLAFTGQSLAGFTTTALSYYSQLVTPPDATPPSTPTALVGVADVLGANISWTGSSDNIGVAGYNVFRCTPPAAGDPCGGVWISNSTTISFTDSSLTSNTLYNYQVQAFDLANNLSPLSTPLSLQTYRTTAAAATGLVATAVSPQEIAVSWVAPSDNTGLNKYLVYSGTLASNLVQIAVTSNTMTAFNNMSLSPATTYYYAVVAVEDGINGPMTPVASATTLPLPTPPFNLPAVATPTSIVLTWQETIPTGGLPIDFYQIDQGTVAGQLVKVGSATTTSYTARSLTPSTTYYFELIAIDTGYDNSVPSNQISVTTLPLPAAPVNVVATANSGTVVTVTWSEVIPPTGLPIKYYYVFRGPSSTDLVQVSTRTASPFVDNTVSPNTTYYYAIEAVDTSQDVSPMSAPAGVTSFSLPAAPVSVVATANAGTQVAVSWSETIPPNGLPIQSYTILRGPSATGLTKLTTQSGSTFTDNGVSPNNTYYYGIEATDTEQEVSAMSATAQVATPALPAAPISVVATANSSTEITVTWSETIPPGGLPIQMYTIFRGTAPTVLNQLTTRSASPLQDTSVSPGITYYYAIEATDTSQEVSPMSGRAYATPPPLPAAPAGLVATANSSTRVTLTWSENIPSKGLPIQYYTVFRGTSPATFIILASTSATTFVDNGAAADTGYYYGVEATDTDKDVSSMSASVQISTPSALRAR
jgi:fibronectin type 3 domain-containing protein